MSIRHKTDIGFLNHDQGYSNTLLICTLNVKNSCGWKRPFDCYAPNLGTVRQKFAGRFFRGVTDDECPSEKAEVCGASA